MALEVERYPFLNAESDQPRFGSDRNWILTQEEMTECPECGGVIKIFNGDTVYCHDCREKLTFNDRYDVVVKIRFWVRR